VFDPDKPVSLLFDACAAIDKGYRLCGGTACGCGGWLEKEPLHQMKNICARETTLGHVMMRVIIFFLIGVVFHGPHGTGLTTQPFFKRALLPLTAIKAPVTL
jgi:hypothetical protein